MCAAFLRLVFGVAAFFGAVLYLFPLPTAGPLFTIIKRLFAGRTNLSLGFGVIAHMFILLEYYNFVFFDMILVC